MHASLYVWMEWAADAKSGTTSTGNGYWHWDGTPGTKRYMLVLPSTDERHTLPVEPLRDLLTREGTPNFQPHMPVAHGTLQSLASCMTLTVLYPSACRALLLHPGTLLW